MSRVLLTGLALVAGVTAALAAWQGPAAVLPAVVMGLVAVAIELVAVRALRRGLAAPDTAGFFAGMGVGMGLRLLGVVLFAGLVIWDRARFGPLAAGLGYVGVLIPLLFLEVRFIR